MRWKIAIAVVVLQMLFFAGWAVVEERRFVDPDSASVVVKTVPVDPRDYLSGQYMALAYEFSGRGSLKVTDPGPDMS